METPKTLICAILGERLSSRKRDWARQNFYHLILSLASQYDAILFCTSAIGCLQQAFYAALQDARAACPHKHFQFWYYGADKWVRLTGFQPIYRVRFDQMRSYPYYNRKFSLQLSAAARDMLEESRAAIYYSEQWPPWQAAHTEIRYARRHASQMPLVLYNLKQAEPGSVQKKFTTFCKR